MGDRGKELKFVCAYFLAVRLVFLVCVCVCVCVLVLSCRAEADKPSLFLSLYNPLECLHDDKPMSTLLCVSGCESQGKHIDYHPPPRHILNTLVERNTRFKK